MGRIGRELASLYVDTVQAPLPARLQTLVRMLEHQDEDRSRELNRAVA